jgi:hypothetical protein
MAITRTIARPTGNQRIGSVSVSSPTNAVGRWVGNENQSPFQSGDGTNLWACFGRVRQNNNAGSAVFSFVSAETGDTNTGLTAVRLHINAASGMSAFGSVNSVTMTRVISGGASGTGGCEVTWGGSVQNSGTVMFTAIVKQGASGAEWRRMQVGAMLADNTFAFGTHGIEIRQSAGVAIDWRAASNLGAGTGFRLLGGYSTAGTGASYHFRGTSNALTFVVLLAGKTWADVGLDPDTSEGVKNWEIVNRDPQRIFDFVTSTNGYVVSYGDLYESDGTTRIQLDNNRVLVGGEKLVSTGGHPGSARVLTLEASADTSRRWSGWPDYAHAHRHTGLATSTGYAPEHTPINGGSEIVTSGFFRGNELGFMLGLADGLTGRLLKPMLPYQPLVPFITNTTFVRGEDLGGIGKAHFSAFGDNHVGHGLSVLADKIVTRTLLHHDQGDNKPTTGDRALSWNMVNVIDDNGVTALAPNIRADSFGAAYATQVGYTENLTAYPSSFALPNGDEVCEMRMASTGVARLGVQKRKADGSFENCVITIASAGSLVGGYKNYALLLPNGHLLCNWNVRSTGDLAAKAFCAIVDMNADISNGANVYAPMTGAPCDGAGGNPTLGAVTTDDDRFNLYGETGESPGTTPSAMQALGNFRFFGCNPAGTKVAGLISVDVSKNATEAGPFTFSRFVLVWDYNPATKTLTRTAKTADLSSVIAPTGAVSDTIQMVGNNSAIMARTLLNGTTKTNGVHFCTGQNKNVGDVVRIYFWPNIFTQPENVIDLGTVYDCGNTGSGSDGVGGKGVYPKTYGHHGERWKRILIEVSQDATQGTIMHANLRAVDLTALLAPYEGGRRIQIIPIDDELVPLPMRA